MKTGITFAVAAVSALGGSSILAGVHLPFISSGYTPPQACVIWYDGCNMCQKLPNGQVSCSNRLCEHRGGGFCRQYEASTSTPETK